MEPNQKDRCDLSGVVPALAGTFKALGDPTRLNLVCLLATDTTGTLGVSDLAALTNVSQPAVSQHLKTLKSERLVESRRDGLYIYYTLNRERMVGFREQFELMYAGIMEKCNRELLRKSGRDRDIRACVIFYSFSGITRRVAEGFRNATGCDLIEVRAKKPYTALSAYTRGVARSRKMACDPIEQGEIDVSGYDLLVIGTPVWAGRAAPPINGAVKALRGCEGKIAAVFSTCLNAPGEALSNLGSALADRGVSVRATISLEQEETRRPDAGGELLKRIIDADPFGDQDLEEKRP